MSYQCEFINVRLKN